MKRIIIALFLLSAASVDLGAQGSATFHVFPQIADGFDTLSTGYVSIIFATNTSNAAATCQMTFYGAGLSGRFPTAPITLPASGGFTAVFSNLGNNILGPLVTGYATMSCDQMVSANVG